MFESEIIPKPVSLLSVWTKIRLAQYLSVFQKIFNCRRL